MSKLVNHKEFAQEGRYTYETSYLSDRYKIEHECAINLVLAKEDNLLLIIKRREPKKPECEISVVDLEAKELVL